MDKNILIFGASSTFGYIDVESGGWVDRLRKFCFGKIRSVDDDYVGVYNLGIDGNGSADVLARMENEIKARLSPDTEAIVIVDVGKNDALMIGDKVPKTPPAEFEKNLREIIALGRKYASQIVLMGLVPAEEAKTAPIPWKPEFFYRNANLKKYGGLLKKIAAEEKVPFIDLWPKSEKEMSAYLSFDGLHPNSEGHQKIFEIVKGFLLERKII